MADKRSNSKRVRYVMRLFVSGDAPNSRVAQNNLKMLQDSFPNKKFAVEIVDVNVHPDIALEYDVFITPTLHILEPKPGGMVYGNLTDTEALLGVLKLQKP